MGKEELNVENLEPWDTSIHYYKEKVVFKNENKSVRWVLKTLMEKIKK